jgi:argininosuccinate lyase
MPNKNNPDTIELLRAVHGVVQGAQTELASVLSLPSGYQRDLQATKPPLLRAFGKGLQALELLPDLLASFEWQSQRMRESITPEMLATDRAQDMATKGIPFRDAYKIASAGGHEISDEEIAKSLENRVSPGGCGRLETGLLEARIKALNN